jgi:hypothetical protein
MNINPKIVICVGIFLSIIAPYFFTQCSSFLYFGRPNEIGDTIGGITAPIVGIMGAWLVYLTFEQQNIANQQPVIERKKKLESVRNLIKSNLINTILPSLEEYESRTDKAYKSTIDSNTEPIILTHNLDLNCAIYDTIDKVDMFDAFSDDINTISFIYERVRYLKNNPFSVYHEKLRVIKGKYNKEPNDANREAELNMEFENIKSNIKISSDLRNAINSFLSI